MKILLTGASGYIGKRLLPVLVESGYEVICCVRDIKRFTPPESLKSRLKIIQVDLLDKASLESIPKDLDGAFYLVHSMSASSDYQSLEQESAINFRNAINQTSVQHVVYLSGIVNESALSKHLANAAPMPELAPVMATKGFSVDLFIRLTLYKFNIDVKASEPQIAKRSHGL